MTKAKKRSTGDYPVGYCKPPEERRFAKGQSGNPKGRPRKVRIDVPSLADIIFREVPQMITVKENGRPVEMPIRQALIRAQIMHALDGKSQAMHLTLPLLQLAQTASAAGLQPTPEKIAAMDPHRVAAIYKKVMSGQWNRSSRHRPPGRAAKGGAGERRHQGERIASLEFSLHLRGRQHRLLRASGNLHAHRPAGRHGKRWCWKRRQRGEVPRTKSKSKEQLYERQKLFFRYPIPSRRSISRYYLALAFPSIESGFRR
jgi:hypothetical protein